MSTNSSVLPIGSVIPSNSIILTPIGNITFTFPRPFTPLPPLVDALISGGTIQICVVAFIDSTLGNVNFTIFQNNSIDNEGKPTVQFYAQYGAGQTQAQKFTAYQVTFSLNQSLLPNNLSITDINTIQVFLWDSDPIASRGTITNVQH
ncbi:hypothetical protein ACLI09_15805 [Flavobacterium sp. RHBU_24]|uniref:hypothetical protein n=1 Tax=Flavobacterium sp. RHBU_24 TaxID=3391185 RepID=UPI003985479A